MDNSILTTAAVPLLFSLPFASKLISRLTKLINSVRSLVKEVNELVKEVKEIVRQK